MRAFLMKALRTRSYVLDIMVALLLVTTIFFLVGQRNLSQQLKDLGVSNQRLNRQSLDVAERVKSCTDPAGACYKAGTARTASVVAEINRIAILSSLCAKKPYINTIPDLQKCIRQMKSK